jgi:hypothetical protein
LKDELGPAGDRRVAPGFLRYFLLAIGCLGLLATGHHPKPGPGLATCDPYLVPSPGNPLGYRLRGERCEGLYVLQVAGSGGLSVTGFTEVAVALDIPREEPLVLNWSSPEPLPARLRAVSLRRQLYYRMDATTLPTERTFRWPTDVLGSLALTGQELAVAGWIDLPLRDRVEQVYIPLRWGPNRTGHSAGHYEVIVVPGTELEEVFVTLTTVDGEPGAFLMRNEPLGYVFYPEQRPIRVKLPRLHQAGVYHLRITALHRRGGSSSTALHFYHAGNAQ